MKAILGNFTKISESEFRLKKDLQFADISMDESQKIQHVQYQDKQDIEIGDILTHQEEITPTIKPVVSEKPMPTTTIPKKRNIFKKILGWIGNKLSNYSDR